jgi:hypothetical protein
VLKFLIEGLEDKAIDVHVINRQELDLSDCYKLAGAGHVRMGRSKESKIAKCPNMRNSAEKITTFVTESWRTDATEFAWSRQEHCMAE